MGCPKCGSDRLKGAPATLSSAAWIATGRRRYRCADCGWAGWKHRLQRRTDSGMSLQQRQAPDIRAKVFFGCVVTLLTLTTVLLLRSCDSGGPADLVSVVLP